MKLSEHIHTPPVSSLMTPFPHFVEPESRVEDVAKLMDDHGIHHIPVKQAGQVIGLISRAAVSAALRFATARNEMCTADLQSSEPCLVDFSAPLKDALRNMATAHADAAVVLRDGKLAGIVTVTDVCEALCQFLEDRFPDSDGAA